MAVAKITKRMVEKPTLPKAGHAVTWDASPGMGGFGIRVSPAGRVSYLVRYWNGERERWSTIGHHPRMTLDDAKAEARKMLRDAGDGRDPVAEQKAAEAAAARADATTVAALVDRWLEALPTAKSKRGRLYSARTIEGYRDSIRHAVAQFGSGPLLTIAPDDVARWHERVTRRAGAYAANRSLDAFRIFLKWCRKRGAAELPAAFDPTLGVEKNAEQKRGEAASVRMSAAQEARLVAAILGEMESDPIGATALLVLLDTGRRLNEVLRMEWSRLDFTTAVYDLGKSKGRPAGDGFYVPTRALDAIRALPRIVGCRWIFSGHGGRSEADKKAKLPGRRVGLQSIWERVKVAAGLESWSADLGAARLHDLRHNRLTAWLAAGVSPGLIAAQAGHSSLDQLMSTYNHVRIARDVAPALAAVEPVAPAKPADVVAIGGRP